MFNLRKLFILVFFFHGTSAFGDPYNLDSKKTKSEYFVGNKEYKYLDDSYKDLLGKINEKILDTSPECNDPTFCKNQKIIQLAFLLSTPDEKYYQLQNKYGVEQEYLMNATSNAVQNYPKRILSKVQEFTRKEQWILLENYARDLHGRYELRYYWMAEAQFRKGNLESAKLNYKRLISFDSVPHDVKGTAKERLLQISYSQNNFSEDERAFCDGDGSYIRNYLCGLNFLVSGDSVGGIYSLVRALLKIEKSEDQNTEGLKIEILELIEGQRDYLAEDLLKIN